MVSMLADIIKKDLRITKTEKALNNAMSELLRSRSFGKITVRDICAEALTSRATFYAHFLDKYDLLEYWLMQFIPKDIKEDFTYEQIEVAINQFVRNNEVLIKNLLSNTDDETLKILHKSILFYLNVNQDRGAEIMDPKFVVTSSFFSGAIFNYLLWQIDNRFPPNVPPMNKYLFNIIVKFKEIEFE